MRTWLWFVVVLLSCTSSFDAHAEVSSAAERSAARDLGTEGVEEYQAGNYKGALDRLEKAYNILRAPALALWSARALEKNGRLVEAAERYLETSRVPTDQAGDKAVQAQAIAEAEAERAELLPRIPKLTIEIKGATSGYAVQVRDKEVPPKMIGVPIPVDPGELTVRVTAGEKTLEKKIVLGERARETVSFDLTGIVTAGGDAPGAGSTAEPTDEAPRAKPSATRKIVAWSFIGAGAAAVIGGGITTGILAGKGNSLDCVDGLCPPGSDPDEVASFNSLRPVPTILFAVGGALVATGLVIHLTAPRSDSVASIETYVGLASAGVKGRF